MNMASTKANWPLGRGFERFYGFLGAETNQWYPDLIHDNHPVEQPYSPEDGYHLSVDLTDQAIAYIDDVKSIAPDRPVFLYYAPGCAHAPHHVPKEWIDKYKGTLRRRLRTRPGRPCWPSRRNWASSPRTPNCPPVNPLGTRQNRTGPNGEAFPALDETTRWADMTADEQALSSRMAEVYAGFLSHGDDQIGRLVDHLEEIGQLDNTIIIVVSDNGASGEGGPNGSVNEMLFMNGIPDTMDNNITALDELGGLKTYNHYSTGWAMAFNTPFKMWKRYASFEGGTADPCIISWPAGITARGEVREQYHHAIDIVPTVLDCLRRCAAGGGPRRHPDPDPGRQHALQLRRRRRALGTAHPVLFDAGHQGDLPRRLEGGHHAPGDRRLGALRAGHLGAVPLREATVPSCTTSPRRTPAS